jgi:hypothetical protein
MVAIALAYNFVKPMKFTSIQIDYGIGSDGIPDQMQMAKCFVSTESLE